MKYQKIRGKNIAECMMKLRSSYGADAIILDHREIDNGGLLGSGLFSRKSYEVEYMLPEKNLAKGAQKPPASVSEEKSSLLSLQPSIGLKKKTGYGYKSKEDIGSTTHTSLGENEKRTLRRFFDLQNSAYRKSKETKGQDLPASPSPSVHRPQQTRQGSAPLMAETQDPGESDAYFLRIKEQLCAAQLSPAFASSFIRQLEDNLSRKEKEEYRNIEQKTLASLAGLIRAVPSQAPVRGECRAIMLMGPTGSGKTTSLAKLAARFHFIDKRAVSIYSLDHYRLAATEQLKTYASVMGLDFQAPLNKEDFAEALRRDGAEIILIDTSGAGYPDEKRLDELKIYAVLCGEEISLERHLVLAANTNPALLEKILLAYDRIGFDKLILTKIDETDFIGAFIEIADKFKRPFAFLMDGQEVPANIREADSKEMASMILGL